MQLLKYSTFFLGALLLLVSCQKEIKQTSTISRSLQVEQRAQDYFQTFADRNDWNKLLSFYRDDLQFEDVMLQLKLDSLWQFKRFYNWEAEAGNFQKLSPDQDHLTVHTLVANDSVAVARVTVNPFYYYGELKESEWGMEATFWLFFDEDLKIKKQIDWIEYEPAVFESVIKRVRENGVEKIPAWLDLSK